MPWYLYISMCIMYIVLTSHGGFLGQWEELEGQRRRSSHPVVSSVWFFTLLWRTCSMSTSQTGEACVCPHGRQLCTLSHCRRSLQASHVYAIGPVGLTKPCSNFFRADLLAIHVYIFLKTLNIYICRHTYLLFLQRLWEQDCLVNMASSLHVPTFWLEAECLRLGDGPQSWFSICSIHHEPKHSPKNGRGQVWGHRSWTEGL